MVFDGLLDFIFGVFLVFKTPCFGVTFSTFRFFVFMFRLGLVMWDWVRSSMMRGMVDRSMMDWMVGPLGIRGRGMMWDMMCRGMMRHRRIWGWMVGYIGVVSIGMCKCKWHQ